MRAAVYRGERSVVPSEADPVAPGTGEVRIAVAYTGSLQELRTVPEEWLVRVPDGLPLRHAALAEPVAVAVHDVRRSGLGDCSDREAVADLAAELAAREVDILINNAGTIPWAPAAGPRWTGGTK